MRYVDLSGIASLHPKVWSASIRPKTSRQMKITLQEPRAKDRTLFVQS